MTPNLDIAKEHLRHQLGRAHASCDAGLRSIAKCEATIAQIRKELEAAEERRDSFAAALEQLEKP